MTRIDESKFDQGGGEVAVRGTSPRGPKHFHVYGGPHGGTLARVKGGQTTYSKVDRSHPQGLLFRYVLVSAAYGGKAFVPEDDDCLRIAASSARGERGDRETETLAAEIRRRNL